MSYCNLFCCPPYYSNFYWLCVYYLASFPFIFSLLFLSHYYALCLFFYLFLIILEIFHKHYLLPIVCASFSNLHKHGNGHTQDRVYSESTENRPVNKTLLLWYLNCNIFSVLQRQPHIPKSALTLGFLKDLLFCFQTELIFNLSDN